MSDEQRMLTVAEVAEQLRVSEWTVRRHIEAGHAPGAVDVGVGQVPRYRIPVAEVELLRSHLRPSRAS